MWDGGDCKGEFGTGWLEKVRIGNRRKRFRPLDVRIHTSPLSDAPPTSLILALLLLSAAPVAWGYGST